MKVQSGDLTRAQVAEASGTQETGRTAKTRVNPSTSVLQDDSVEISDFASRISNLSAVHETRRSERVSQLAAQYARGEYHPDAAALSCALVSDALSGGSSE